MKQINPIRLIRTILGLEQSELAQLLGISRQMVTHLENNKRKLSDKYKNKLLEIIEQKKKDYPLLKHIRFR